MIYSVLDKRDVPVTLTKKIIYVDDNIDYITRYCVNDSTNGTPIGYVDLADTKNGAKVLYATKEEEKKNLYKHFCEVADQIGVEHCLKRGIDRPYIQFVPARNTYVMHFLRGNRFVNEEINIYLERITKHLLKGKKILTDFLGYQKMYMPVNMINKIKEKIRTNPLLKK